MATGCRGAAAGRGESDAAAVLVGLAPLLAGLLYSVLCARVVNRARPERAKPERLGALRAAVLGALSGVLGCAGWIVVSTLSLWGLGSYSGFLLVLSCGAGAVCAWLCQRWWPVGRESVLGR